MAIAPVTRCALAASVAFLASAGPAAAGPQETHAGAYAPSLHAAFGGLGGLEKHKKREPRVEGKRVEKGNLPHTGAPLAGWTVSLLAASGALLVSVGGLLVVKTSGALEVSQVSRARRRAPRPSNRADGPRAGAEIRPSTPVATPQLSPLLVRDHVEAAMPQRSFERREAVAWRALGRPSITSRKVRQIEPTHPHHFWARGTMHSVRASSSEWTKAVCRICRDGIG